MNYQLLKIKINQQSRVRVQVRKRGLLLPLQVEGSFQYQKKAGDNKNNNRDRFRNNTTHNRHTATTTAKRNGPVSPTVGTTKGTLCGMGNVASEKRKRYHNRYRYQSISYSLVWHNGQNNKCKCQIHKYLPVLLPGIHQKGSGCHAHSHQLTIIGFKGHLAGNGEE